MVVYSVLKQTNMRMKETQNLTVTLLLARRPLTHKLINHYWARAVMVISENMLYQDVNEDNEHKHPDA